jgi:hypothetical protein
MRRTLRRSLLHMQFITPFKLEPCEAQQDWPPPQGSRKATVPPALHFITALCLTSNWKLDCSICKNPTLWSYIFATHLAEKLSPSSAGRQPFSKRHTHRPGLPAPHTFSFLVLSTAIIRIGYSSTSSARGFMQANMILLLLLLLLHHNLAVNTLTTLLYIIYFYVSWKPNTSFYQDHHFPVVSRYHASFPQISSFCLRN